MLASSTGVSNIMTNATIESPSRNGDQTVFEIACFAKDGRRTRTIVLTKKTVFRAGVIGLFMWLAYTIGGDELGKWAQRDKADSLRPAMEQLANNGQDEAALWLAKNYPKTEIHRVAPLAEKGIPEAMLYQGFNVIRTGDKNGGKQWIEKSAAAGNATAVEILKRETNL